MKIGYDAKRAVSNMTGLGNYSRLVIESVAEEYPDSNLLLYTPSLKENPRLRKIREYHNVEFRLPPPSGFQGSLWRTFGITNCLQADKVDIFHGLSNELPLNITSSHIPSVVTVHDVIYRRLPEEYSFIDRKLYDWKYGASCRNATRIIAISERTKQDIVEIYGISPDKIDVVYQGCDPSFARRLDPHHLEEVRRRLGLPEKYVLQVGTIEPRKNLELSVRALSSLPADVSLLAVGRNRKGYKERVEKIAGTLGVAGRIVFRDDITFADLPAVNQMAQVILYPSKYEGFGIPVLEGLSSGRPVVAATGSCLEEAGGDAAIYVNPNDPRRLGEAVNAILSNRHQALEMIEKGEAYSARFSNDRIASSIMEVYRKIIKP